MSWGEGQGHFSARQRRGEGGGLAPEDHRAAAPGKRTRVGDLGDEVAAAPLPRLDLASSGATSSGAPTIQRQEGDGTPTPPSLAEWPQRLRAAADQAALDDLWPQAVDAVAAAAASGTAASEEVTAIAHAAGEQVWSWARQAASAVDGDDGSIGHYDTIYPMRAVVTQRLGSAQVDPVLSLLDTELDYAARGATTICWDREAPSDRPELAGVPIRRVLLTGFDPFRSDGQAPTSSDWNPSGAAVMRLDGSQLDVGGEVVAIEGVVYPVSFQQFDRGIVERVVSEQAVTADAIITVSMDPRLGPDQPVRIEQYAVGVHATEDLNPHPDRGVEPMTSELVRIPSQTGAAPGPPVIDAAERDGGPPTDIAGIAEDSGASVGTKLDLQFDPDDFGRAQAVFGDRATADGVPTLHTLRVTDEATAADIVADARGDFDDAASTSPAITFDICTERGRTESFTANLMRGPGGSFLSNEVAYRTQRELSASGSDATSFHVHTTNQRTDLAVLVERLQAIVRETIIRRQAAGPSRGGTRTSQAGG